MIKSIYSQTLESKNLLSVKESKNKNVSIPIETKNNTFCCANYSTDNLKANYLPVNSKSNISFGANTDNTIIVVDGKGFEVPWELPEPIAKVDVSDLPKENRYIGDYWGEFSDDLAVLLKSDKSVNLKYDPEFNPDLFVHSFANHFSTKSANHGVNTKVVLLHDSQYAVEEALELDYLKSVSQNGKVDVNSLKQIDSSKIKKMSVLNLLKNISDSGSERTVVFVKDFDYLNSYVESSKFGSLNEFIARVCPNLSIVGLSPEVKNNKFSEMMNKLEKTAKAMGIELDPIPTAKSDFTEMNIPKMGTGAVKELLKKNPELKNEIIEKYYSEADVKISAKALDDVVERVAVKMNGDIFNNVKRVLDIEIAAKINEAGATSGDKELHIDLDFNKKFFSDHAALLDMYAAQDGRFSLAENVKTTLKDVGGIGSVKDDIQDDIIAYLKNPKKFIAERGVAPKGILLEGPPGTGKTLLARAIAGETNTPFISASGSEFVQKYVGEGAARVRELFDTARKAAANSENKTALVFIDEFDALAKARGAGSSGGSQEYEQTLNQFLQELDGFNNKESKTKIVVIAATNRKDMLDSAAVRPGRFDDTYKIDNPRTNADRLEILNIHARKLKFENELQKSKILSEAAEMTDEMSGAEIAEVMKKAQKVVSKRLNNKFITHNDVVEGLLQVYAGPVQKATDERPFSDIVKTVRHEGGHATAIDFLKPLFGEKISFITLDSRGNFLGAVFHNAPKVNPNFKSVILSAAVSYAGGLAEPGFDSEGRAAGARQDLNQATNLFRRAVTEWGQGIYTPPIGLAPVDGKAESEAAEGFYETMRNINAKNIEKDINLLSKTSEKIAKMINEFHEGFLDTYVERFKNNAGKGGNNLSGGEFANLRKAWLAETGKVEAEKQLLKKVEKILDQAFNSNKDIVTKLVRKVKTVM